MRIALKYTGDVEAGQFVPGVPAQDLELDDGDDSEDRYAAQVLENTQHQPPILLTRRICERLILWGAEEDRDVQIAERLAFQLTAGGLYEREGEATGVPRVVTPAALGETVEIAGDPDGVSANVTTGAEGAATGGGEADAGEAE